MRTKVQKYSFLLGLLLLLPIFISCSKDEDVRMPEDLVGVWSPDSSTYLEFTSEYAVHKLSILYQDGESIGKWATDAYLYEPGYHILIYSLGNKAYVYQIVSLTPTSLTWCPVKEITINEADNKSELGKLLGEIIKEAQEGFKLDPALYETLKKIPENEFFKILESLNITYPWDF